MGISATVQFKKSPRGQSYYCYHLCVHCHKFYEQVINVEFCNGEVSLSSLVHEINECEVVNLLIKKFGQPKQQVLKIDKKLQSKYKNVIDFKRHKPKEVLVSHIVSPYGCCGCMLPNYKNKVHW